MRERERILHEPTWYYTASSHARGHAGAYGTPACYGCRVTNDHRTRRADERRPGPAPEWESPRHSRAREALVTARPRGSDRGRRTARPHPMPILVGLTVLALAVAAIIAMAPRAGGPSQAAAIWSAVATQAVPAQGPTPAFASFRGTQLLLPVPAASITAIAFHQSSFNDTYKMTPLVAMRANSEVKAEVETARANGQPIPARTGAQADTSGVWTGWALEVWRSNVNGKMDSAADCGAPPGTPVVAPLTGTVMRVRSYKLYHKYPDFEIQIKPDAWNDVDVIILHIDAPLVTEGARVVAGVTQIASVRNLASTVSGLQLRSYTTEGGNHTHVQMNRIPKPDEVWQLGQDPPGFDRKGS